MHQGIFPCLLIAALETQSAALIPGPPLTLAEALDAPDFAWTTSGQALWSPESEASHDGIDAAQAGTLPFADGEARLSTSVTGPGLVRFWWKVEAREYGYGLRFFIDAALQVDRVGAVDWEERAFYVPPGEHPLRWSFYVDDNGPFEGPTAWVDQFSFTPGETLPLIWQQPISQTVPAWSRVRLTTQAAGTPPLTYQWQLGESNLAGATNPVMELRYGQVTNSGPYRCIISNAHGAITSTVALLTVRPSAVVAFGGNYHQQSDVPLNLTNIVAISAGVRHSLALRADGTLVAWGNNEYDQTAAPARDDLVAIAAGGYHNLALTAEGSVIAWGADWDGQARVPSDLMNVVAIGAGDRHSLAVRADGTVAVWGSNSEGQGNVPPGLTNIVAVTGGAFHSLALRSDGIVVAWGARGVNFGQTNIPSGLSNVIAITAGQLFSGALKSDGRVVTWARTDVPADLPPVIALSARGGHVVARTSQGRVVAWGWNGEGQTTVPPSLPEVASVAAGDAHTLVLLGSRDFTAKPLDLLYRNGTFEMSVETARGQACFLEARDTLRENSWRFLLGIPGDGSRRTLTDPGAHVPHRFYRARLAP
jgi:hypothetical protein